MASVPGGCIHGKGQERSGARFQIGSKFKSTASDQWFSRLKGVFSQINEGWEDWMLGGTKPGWKANKPQNHGEPPAPLLPPTGPITCNNAPLWQNGKTAGCSQKGAGTMMLIGWMERQLAENQQSKHHPITQHEPQSLFHSVPYSDLASIAL